MINIMLLRSDEIDDAKKFIRSIFPKAMVHITEYDTILIAKSRNKIVGFSHVVDDGERIILQGIGVHPSKRGEGIGTMLIEHTLEMLSDIDRPILLKVKVMNPAIYLYQRFGFSIKRFGTVHTLIRRPNN